MSRQVSAAYSIFSHPPPSPPISTTSSECGVPPSQESAMADMTSETRRKSGMSDYSAAMSAMPSELSLNTSDSDPYTPLKRTPLRESSSRSARWSARSGTPTRKSYVDGLETPRSTTSQSVRSQGMVKRAHTPGSRAGTPSMEVGTPSQRDKHPLVLLHATLLPVAWPYSMESMAAVLPDYILENLRLLQSKLNDVTIMGRGVLVGHPRNEYEVLEESILETLELMPPRVLKCGHFGMDDEQEERRRSRRVSSASHASDGTVNGESNICDECHEPIKYPNSGVGAGKRRWEVKIFAANGLMKSGAWSAAWSMMERVDVEIKPWIPEDLRRKLDAIRAEEIAEARQIEAQLEEEALAAERMRLQAMSPVNNSMSVVLAPLPAETEQKQEEPEPEIEQAPIEESQEETFVDSFIEDSEPTPAPVPELEPMEPLGEEFQITPPPTKEEQAQMDLFEDFLQQSPPEPAPPIVEEVPRPVATEPVPLSALLKNYLVFQIKTKGPLVVIFLLAAAVLFAAYKMSLMAQFSQQPESKVQQAFPAIEEEQFFKTVSVTHIETTTSVSIATVTEQLVETTTALSVETITETQHSVATEISLSTVTEQLIETSTAIITESFTETKIEHLHVLGTSTVKSVSTTTETLSLPAVTVTQTLPVETTTQSILLSLEPVTHISTVYLAAVGTPAAQNPAQMSSQMPVQMPVQVSAAAEVSEAASTTTSVPLIQESAMPSESSAMSSAADVTEAQVPSPSATPLSEAAAAEVSQVDELEAVEDDQAAAVDPAPSVSPSASEALESHLTHLADEGIREPVEEGVTTAAEATEPTSSSMSEASSPPLQTEGVVGEEATPEAAADVIEDTDAGAAEAHVEHEEL